jgi:PAS domain-containing protein
MIHKDGSLVWILDRGKVISRDESGKALRAVGTHVNITKMKRLHEELESANKALLNAMKKVSTLEGILPICSGCKKIRDDDNKWNFLEDYIQSRTKAEFSHGLCPDCAKKLYPEIFKGKKE